MCADKLSQDLVIEDNFSDEFWQKVSELEIDADALEKAFSLVMSLRIKKTLKESLLLMTLKAESKKLKANLTQEGKISPIEADELEKKHLLNEKYEQDDFFIINGEDLPYIKDDIASMAHPVFALKSGDTRTIEYETVVNGDQVKKIIIRPSAELGRATIYDKDVWIYLISKLMQAKFEKKTIKKTVEFTSADFFMRTNRGLGGNQYNLLKNSLNRLSGTRIETNIETGGKKISEGFGLLDSWKITEEGKNQAPLKILVTLPDWLYNSIQSREVLQISRDYFRLKKAVDRKIYELARKHCGKQREWRIKLHNLKDKTGSTTPLKNFKQAVKSLAQADILPEYKVSFDELGQIVIFTNRRKIKEELALASELDYETNHNHENQYYD